MNILNTFTINISGRGVDGLCRASAECNNHLAQVWSNAGNSVGAFMGISTEIKEFPEICLTMLIEGFFSSGQS